MAHFLTLQPVDRILELIGSVAPLGTEDLPLECCLSRVLGARFAAPENLPGFARSTMDGYAVRARDVFGASEGSPALLEYVGECPTGEEPSLAIGPGETARIWTGGMLPEGADAVVMLEYARPAGDHQVELTRPAAPLENVIEADEDAVRGQELLPEGTLLRPQELGLLAALGQRVVAVRKKPRVAVISTGDEVVPVDGDPKPGQVRDINSYTLAALVTAAGGDARALGIAGDDEKELAGFVTDALGWADIILVSGGSSAGMRDFTVHAFAGAGADILAHGVAISPGKPLIMARKGETFLWGLPGHAASALVCAEVFIRPLVRRLLGMAGEETWRKGLNATLTRPVASAQGRRDYIRVRLATGPDGSLAATPVMGKSGLITTLVEADALIICPEDREGLDAGQTVAVHLLL
ncbi:Molybdenum cofactor synthesis domain protein [uncultured delta proteobacterium]|uniref:Molybdopterin molybdenumtransferase n=1 Tax=uncultured delta proteobacterium TaxID=34034 RepID=A0A212K9R0_9DELT|nr:Molybdenum cofactor synthesis domain protein [uncultured delta proteobacterium]